MLKCSLKYFEHYLVSMWNDGSLSVSAVAQLCPTLYNPMNRSTSGLPVHHQLPEFTHTHIHWVGDAIQPSHSLSSPSPPALNLSQDQGLFKWVNPLHQVAKLLAFQLQCQSFQCSIYLLYIYIYIYIFVKTHWPRLLQWVDFYIDYCQRKPISKIVTYLSLSHWCDRNSLYYLLWVEVLQ